MSKRRIKVIKRMKAIKILKKIKSKTRTIKRMKMMSKTKMSNLKKNKTRRSLSRNKPRLYKKHRRILANRKRLKRILRLNHKNQLK